MNGLRGKLAVVPWLAWAAASTGAIVFAAAMSAAAGEPLEETVVRTAKAEGVPVPQWVEELRSDGPRGRGEAGRDAVEDGQR